MKTRISRVFLDLDDVLNTFTMYALHRMKCGCSSVDYSEYPIGLGWDIAGAANAMLGEKKYKSREDFFNALPPSVWRLVPRSPEFGYLLHRSIKLVGQDNVFILTKPTEDPACAAGKVAWIQGGCPAWLHNQYLIGLPKHVCAQPGALLIDDNMENVYEFRSAGGEAIVFPRPWNTCDGLDPRFYLSGQFSKYAKR
jgi:5'(3')-deoxyribonucleotidase